MTNIPSPGRLSRKNIKGFAHGVAHKFFSSAEHYAWLAYKHRAPRVVIDLVTLKVEPPEFDIERNRILAEICRCALKRNIESLAPPGTVTSAVLTADFGIDDFQRNERTLWLGASVFTVTLTDDRGKPWRAELQKPRVLALP